MMPHHVRSTSVERTQPCQQQGNEAALERVSHRSRPVYALLMAPGNTQGGGSCMTHWPGCAAAADGGAGTRGVRRQEG